MAFFEISRSAQRRARIAASLPTEHPDVYDRISELIDDIPDPSLLSAEERIASMRALHRLSTRLNAAQTDLAAHADAAGDSRVLRAGTTGIMIAAATGQTPAAGSAIVATAQALQRMPAVHDAYSVGTIGTAHVVALTRAANHLEDFTALETTLVEIASHVDAAELRTIANSLISQQRGPASIDAEHLRLREKRGLSLSETPGGMFRIDGWLDPVEGRRLRDTLAVFTDPRTPNDHRTAIQRRADALTDLVAAANANSRPLGVSGLSILVDVDEIDDGTRATLDDGHPIGPATFDLLTCATTAAVVFGRKHGDTFVPIALGRAARRATRWQWAALIARDRGCIRCGRSPRFCQAHHILHWRHGGLTDVSNLVLLCDRCHADLHHGHYTITVDAHDIPHITPSRSPPADLPA